MAGVAEHDAGQFSVNIAGREDRHIVVDRAFQWGAGGPEFGHVGLGVLPPVDREPGRADRVTQRHRLQLSDGRVDGRENLARQLVRVVQDSAGLFVVEKIHRP